VAQPPGATMAVTEEQINMRGSRSKDASAYQTTSVSGVDSLQDSKARNKEKGRNQSDFALWLASEGPFATVTAPIVP
jgi:hypothetical protein